MILKYRMKSVGELQHLNNIRRLIKKGKQAVLFYKYDGFGISEALLDKFDQMEVEYQGQTYFATSDLFRKYGIEYIDRQDKQLILPRKWWDVRSKEQRSMF